MPRDLANLRFDAMVEQKSSCSVIDPARQLLPRPDLEVCCSSSCCLGVAEDHRLLHPLGVLGSLFKSNPYRV